MCRKHPQCKCGGHRWRWSALWHTDCYFLFAWPIQQHYFSKAAQTQMRTRGQKEKTYFKLIFFSSRAFSFCSFAAFSHKVLGRQAVVRENFISVHKSSGIQMAACGMACEHTRAFLPHLLLKPLCPPPQATPKSGLWYNVGGESDPPCMHKMKFKKAFCCTKIW